MTNEITTLSLEDASKEIDRIVDEAGPIAVAEATGFASTLKLAEAVAKLREIFIKHPGIRRTIQSMQDTRLGFLTDRSPKALAYAKSRGKTLIPYTYEEIVECVVEAMLQGYRISGNEFNVIAGGFYPAKNGKYRKIIETPGVTDFKFTTTSPLYGPDGRSAKVQCYASWLLNGTPVTLGVSEKDKGKEDTLVFTVRVNEAMGEDAVVGKAISKLFSRVLMRLSGKVMPEATDLEYEGPTALPEPSAQASGVTLTPVEPLKVVSAKEPEAPQEELQGEPGKEPEGKTESSEPTEEELREQVTALAEKAGIPAEASEIFEGRYIQEKKAVWKKATDIDTLALIVAQSDFVVADMKIKWNKWQREIQEYLNTLKTGQSNGDYDAVLAKEYIAKRGNGYADWVKANLARIASMPSKNQGEIRDKWARLMKNVPFPEAPNIEAKAPAEDKVEVPPAKKPWKVPTVEKRTYKDIAEAAAHFDEVVKDLCTMDNPKFTIENFTAWLDKEMAARNGQYKNLDHFKAATMVHARFKAMIDKFLSA